MLVSPCTATVPLLGVELTPVTSDGTSPLGKDIAQACKQADLWPDVPRERWKFPKLSLKSVVGRGRVAACYQLVVVEPLVGGLRNVMNFDKVPGCTVG